MRYDGPSVVKKMRFVMGKASPWSKRSAMQEGDSLHYGVSPKHEFFDYGLIVFSGLLENFFQEGSL
jgi:hypothetical protein